MQDGIHDLVVAVGNKEALGDLLLGVQEPTAKRFPFACRSARRKTTRQNSAPVVVAENFTAIRSPAAIDKVWRL